jgi:murein DD-endopeptidase MepM/ murein hydrolase activator NlpD
MDVSWRNDFRERTRVIGRVGRDLGRDLRQGASRDLNALRALPAWVRETILCLFIFAVLLGAAHSEHGMSSGIVSLAKGAVSTDITYDEVKAFALSLPDRLKSFAALDLRNFWSRSVTGSPTELAWPVTGEITSYFGWRANPGSSGMSLHQGIDIDAPKGTEVSVVLNGVVRDVRESPLYGLVVEVEHGGGITTLYGHLDSAAVKKDQKLSQGDVIGTVGESGNATGPHLHFELRKDGIEVDPMTLLPPLVKGP